MACSAGSVNGFPGRRFCLLHLVFFSGTGVLQTPRVSREGTIFALNVLSPVCYGCTCHFSLSVREMIAGVSWGKMLQAFLLSALNPPGLLDLGCTAHPSSLAPGAAPPLWPPASHLQVGTSMICCLAMAEGVGVC